ncbi:MAG: hypothetical protein LBE18_06300 [Planctomycetaceae bacterium]|jgi:hypothetical protein|nr:hypothetical protein [Planctomycetaceae bacterium]
MSSNRNQFSLSEIINRNLRALRRILRFYIFFDGIIVTFFYIFLLLCADFLLDRFFQFALPLRVSALVVMILTVFYVLWKYLFRRFLVNIKSGQLAYLFERYVPELNESLVTVVEISGIKHDPNEVAPEFLQEVLLTASEKLRGINVRKFFRSGQLIFRLFCLILVLIATIFLCVKYSDTAEIWFSRNLLLSNQEWPRRSRITADGFTDGYIRIRRGDSFTMLVRADTTMPLVPDTIRLRIGSEESGYRIILIDQFRIDTIDKTDWRIFSYTFAEMLETVNLRINAADSIIDGLKIEVVPPPVLADAKLLQKFPDYMQRTERTIKPSIRTVIPDGTSIELVLTSSKPLLNAKIIVNNNEPVTIREEKIESAFTKLEYNIENLRSDTKIGFVFQDIDNLKNKQSIRFELNILKDQPPTVTARFDGIGNVITPNATLPTIGEITDDNGIANVIYRYKIYHQPKQIEDKNNSNNNSNNSSNIKSDNFNFHKNLTPNLTPKIPMQFTIFDWADNSDELKNSTENTNSESDAAAESESAERTTDGTTEIEGIGNAQTLFNLNTEFNAEKLNLTAGDKLSLRIEAMDKFNLDLPKTNQIGLGQSWELEIVTPEQLKLILETREISLRQHFETLIGEVEITKRLINTENYPLKPEDSLVKMVEEMKIPDNTPEEEKEEKQNELDSKKKELLGTISKEQAVLGQYNISRALRDTQKEVYELRTIVDTFKTIRREMINNKIFNSESESRIDIGIISPITSLIERDFPELDRLINIFDKTLTIRDKPTRQEAIQKRKFAIDQIDIILKKMTTIRDNMISMESYNEIIDILRSIIKNQKQIQIETEELRKKQIKELLLNNN